MPGSSERQVSFAPPPRRRRRLLDRLGWWWTVIAVLPVAVILGIALLTRSPAVDPAPTDYRDAACSAFGELATAVDELSEAMARTTAGDRDAAFDLVQTVEDRVAEAYRQLADLPPWPPGSPLERQLAALILHVETGAGHLADAGSGAAGAADAASGSIGQAEEIRDQIQRSLDNDDYGFNCA